ncbi:Hypothetical protein CINCED_3A007083 [Cinara cedri]|uniref:Uncharacterized protein n=1 Tax=Cinara cedri TaxID=506608 RepID=A0A5E4MQM3_9HEMI|nr:Hypothetical protein CINCED_3A007083 [Cinara cedri]
MTGGRRSRGNRSEKQKEESDIETGMTKCSSDNAIENDETIHIECNEQPVKRVGNERPNDRVLCYSNNSLPFYTGSEKQTEESDIETGMTKCSSDNAIENDETIHIKCHIRAEEQVDTDCTIERALFNVNNYFAFYYEFDDGTAETDNETGGTDSPSDYDDEYDTALQSLCNKRKAERIETMRRNTLDLSNFNNNSTYHYEFDDGTEERDNETVITDSSSESYNVHGIALRRVFCNL